MTDRFKRGGRDFFETRWGYAVVTFVIVVIVFTLLILTGWLKPDRSATSGSRSPSPILLIRFLVFLVLIPLRFLWSRFRSAGHSDPSAPTKDPDVGYPRSEDYHTETIHLGATPYAPYASHPHRLSGRPTPPCHRDYPYVIGKLHRRSSRCGHSRLCEQADDSPREDA